MAFPLFRRTASRTPARRLRVDEMESRLTPALAVTIDATTLTGPEGTAVTMTSTVTDATTASYAWTVIKDGGATPFATGTNADFTFTPDDNGTYDVTLVVTDTADSTNPTATDTETFMATNVAPIASLSGSSVSVPGLPVSFTLDATDPSSVDTTAGFTFNIDWNNDGAVDETVTGPAGTVVTHTFAGTGSATVSITATDKDGGTSAPVTQSVAIKQVALIDDPLNPGKKLLAVGGTDGNDRINLIPGGRVSLNGMSQGAFAGASRIAVYGLAGDDNIHLAGAIRIAAWLDGGEGNDQLKGAKGNDVLRGGAGDDHLDGSQGADILIGGEGADRILGGPGLDLMIAGTTIYDTDESALSSIAGLWGTGGTVASRVDALRTSADVPLSLGGSSPTVLDDGAADVLTGAAGAGWIFADPTQDAVTGNLKGSFLNDGVVTSHPGNGGGQGNPGGGNGNGNGHGNGNGNGNGHKK